MSRVHNHNISNELGVGNHCQIFLHSHVHVHLYIRHTCNEHRVLQCTLNLLVD